MKPQQPSDSNIVTVHFPGAVEESLFVDRCHQILEPLGFTRESSIACVSTCRDEICQTFHALVSAHWGPVFDNAGQMLRARESASLVTWLPGEAGVLVRARRWLLDSRLHVVLIGFGISQREGEEKADEAERGDKDQRVQRLVVTQVHEVGRH